ncbi:MAG: cysteine desulfurase family protein [Fimbriimonadaceae bacterium]
MWENYFDNAATTPVDPRVLAGMLPFLAANLGNANSLHSWGRRAHEAVEDARVRVAASIGANDPTQIVFTSGATEGNKWVLSNFDKGAVSPFEHSSVWETAREFGYSILANRGLTLAPPVDTQPLISVMAANNEVGTRFDPTGMRSHAHVLHSDFTQVAAKYATPLDALDYVTFSAHKFYGPKGVGALYMRDTPLQPLLHGGEHEGGLRAGTLNVAGIVGMGIAAELAAESREADHAHAEQLGGIVLDELGGLADFQVNGGPNRVPHILSLSFHGLEGEALVIELDAAGFGISSGAACSSRSTEPSHVLTALGMEAAWLRGTVRISFGRFNSSEAARGLGAAICRAVNALRRLG